MRNLPTYEQFISEGADYETSAEYRIDLVLQELDDKGTLANEWAEDETLLSSAPLRLKGKGWDYSEAANKLNTLISKRVDPFKKKFAKDAIKFVKSNGTKIKKLKDKGFNSIALHVYVNGQMQDEPMPSVEFKQLEDLFHSI